MKTITEKDIPRFTPETLRLENGHYLTIDCENDTDHGPPWKDDDGHGPVSEWTTRDKRPGERVLNSDGHSKRYYDFSEAVKLARKDGWDAKPYHKAFPNETASQQAVRAAESDFKYLQDWCEDRWCYVGVIVILRDADGEELGKDSLWGVESCGDYWRECAVEMANTLIASHCEEETERAYWEARDVETV